MVVDGILAQGTLLVRYDGELPLPEGTGVHVIHDDGVEWDGTMELLERLAETPPIQRRKGFIPFGLGRDDPPFSVGATPTGD